MSDLSQEASGPASSEPAGMAQSASGSASSDKGKLRVFISYSREDLDFADQLAAALDFSGFECFIDREGISGGEAWKRRLGNLISEADTVVFVLSPSSARSEICDWEVEEAARLNKRILPANCRPLVGVNPPPRLRDLNYIFFYKEPTVPGSGFGTDLAKLVTALNTDFDWLREHTRYLQRAIEWDKGGRPANRLLSGNDILEAKAWVARHPKSAPEPTALQLDFIRASEDEAEARLSEQRKQLETMAAAQAEREKALHDREEALQQRARVARVRNIALVAVSILALLAGWFGWNADQQRRAAVEQRELADVLLEGATDIVSALQFQTDIDTKRRAIALFVAAKHGDPKSMRILGDAYARGGLLPQDHAKAHEWYERAAAKDDAGAMMLVGMFYQNGQGVSQDYAKAREWFAKAAAKDVTGAMISLGELYENGRGLPKDYTKAREWYEKADGKGDPRAQMSLRELRYREDLEVRLAAAKALPDQTLCGNALNNDKSGWDQTPRYESYVTEASRRKLTVDSCRQTEQERQAAAAKAESERVARPLSDQTLCGNALNNDKSGWDQTPRYERYVTEASRRKLTVDSCREIIDRN